MTGNDVHIQRKLIAILNAVEAIATRVADLSKRHPGAGSLMHDGDYDYSMDKVDEAIEIARESIEDWDTP